MARPKICANKAAAMGERNEFWLQANRTAKGCCTGRLPSALPVQYRDQREQPARGAGIELDLALESLHDKPRAFVVQGAPAHIERLDAIRRRRADRVVIAVADGEI